MENIESKILQLRENLETAAFLVSKGESEKEAHSQIVQSLVGLSEIEALFLASTSVVDANKSDSKEVNKVNRRLKLWASRQNQINSKILNAFLKLERSGVSSITESDLKKQLPEEASFDSNFLQMKIIADRNHGKVFEQSGEKISIWKPVITGVREYEKKIFDI
ncbi:hypothetical protein MNBD_GAMMA18-1724 [hydrothermal vent metagenome]|uniref:Uncharacterized protein n=1 Tax=hydrothermal vent metagenome TaxID=652676 RepID=A0A3B0Z0Q4_9ZZZZ